MPNSLFMNSLLFLLQWPWEHHDHINGNEIAGIGMGAAAFVGAVGYLIIRWRNAKHQ